MTEEHSDTELTEILRKTKQLFGPLYPVLVAPNGTIIDGKHRLEADPEWPKITVDWLTGNQDVEILRLISNWIRRKVSPEEKAQSIARIAELTKWTPTEISENLGIPYRTVVRYFPEELKRSGGYEERIATVAIQEEHPFEDKPITLPLKEEERLDEEEYEEEESMVPGDRVEPLGVEPYKTDESTPASKSEAAPIKPVLEERPKEALQSYLEDLFKRYPAVSEGDDYQVDKLGNLFGLKYREAADTIKNYKTDRRKTQSSGQPKEVEQKPKVEATVKKAELDTWETRKARMSPQISEMEQQVQNELSAKGYFFETQKEVPIRVVIPDLWFNGNPPIACFLDGPVHVGREDRDEELRDLLRKRGVQVLSISYDRPTKQAVDEAVQTILENIKEEASS